MEINKIQKQWLWAGAVLIAIAIILIFTLSNKQKVDQVKTTEPEQVQDTSTDDTNTGGTSSNNTKVITEPISYANALVKYADRRIQLDPMCQAHPSNITYKDNTGIMIDNRSDKTRTVKVGTTFTIKPWGFKIVVLPDIYLKSKTLLVDCDGSRNIATILVQE